VNTIVDIIIMLSIPLTYCVVNTSKHIVLGKSHLLKSIIGNLAGLARLASLQISLINKIIV